MFKVHSIFPTDVSLDSKTYVFQDSCLILSHVLRSVLHNIKNVAKSSKEVRFCVFPPLFISSLPSKTLLNDIWLVKFCSHYHNTREIFSLSSINLPKTS